MTTINKLTDITTEEVSICPHGKNGKRYALSKDASELATQELLSVLSVEQPGESELADKVSAPIPTIALYRILKGYADHLDADTLNDLGLTDLSKMAPQDVLLRSEVALTGDAALEVLAAVLSKLNAADVSKQAVSALIQESGILTDSKIQDAPTHDAEDIRKEREALTKAVEELRKQNEALASDLANERSARRAEVLRKEASELATNDEQSATILAVLKGFEAGASNEDRGNAREALTNVLKANQTQIAALSTEVVTKEEGTAQSDGPRNDGDEIATSVAKIQKEDGCDRMTALSKFFRTNRDAYKRYQSSVRVRV